MEQVIAFYDRHPINAAEVLSKLQAGGKNLDALEPQDLLAFDQDHYGGLEATDVLVERLALSPGERVLDVCAGMGGTSRYLAWKYGCSVTGVELTESRAMGASALTGRVGLADRVNIVQGDATAMPPPALAGQEFDAAVSQEAFLHIVDKDALLGGCYRMLRPGGRLGFTDLLATERLTVLDRERLRDAIQAHSLIPAEDYLARLERAGFREVHWEDLGPWWSRILRERLEMYRALADETVQRFGQAHHDRYIAGYTHFVAAVEAGRLGGGRFIAVK